MSKLRDHADTLRFDRTHRHLAETFRSEGFRRYVQEVIGEVKKQLKIRKEETTFFSCVGDSVQVVFPISGFQYKRLLRAVETFSPVVNMPRYVPSLIRTPKGWDGVPVYISAEIYLQSHSTKPLEERRKIA